MQPDFTSCLESVFSVKREDVVANSPSVFSSMWMI